MLMNEMGLIFGIVLVFVIFPITIFFGIKYLIKYYFDLKRRK